MILLSSMPEGAEWLLLIVPVIFLILFLIPVVFYLLTLQGALNAVSPENRKVSPGNVWLLLIPFFNIIWHFILVGKIADSLKAEFDKRNMPNAETRPGYNVGIIFCIFFAVRGLLTGFGMGMRNQSHAHSLIIPLLIISAISSLGSLICWIIYWVKINDYKNMLLRNNLTTMFNNAPAS